MCKYRIICGRTIEITSGGPWLPFWLAVSVSAVLLLRSLPALNRSLLTSTLPPFEPSPPLLSFSAKTLSIFFDDWMTIAVSSTISFLCSAISLLCLASVSWVSTCRSSCFASTLVKASSLLLCKLLIASILSVWCSLACLPIALVAAFVSSCWLSRFSSIAWVWKRIALVSLCILSLIFCVCSSFTRWICFWRILRREHCVSGRTQLRTSTHPTNEKQTQLNQLTLHFDRISYVTSRQWLVHYHSLLLFSLSLSLSLSLSSTVILINWPLWYRNR